MTHNHLPTQSDVHEDITLTPAIGPTAGAIALGGELIRDEPAHSLEELQEEFADILSRPSFVEQHIGDADTETLKQRYNMYAFIFEVAQRQAGKVSEDTELDFLQWNVGSSEGSEMRMLCMGLKPAVLSNISESYRQQHLESTGVDLKMASVMALAKWHPDLKVTQTTYGYSTEEARPDMTVGVAYSPEAVAKIAQDHEDIFTKLGYDITDEKLAEKVLKDGDRILQSLVLGYPLKGAIFFNLAADSDLAEGTSEISKRFWESLNKILTPEQVAILHDIREDKQRLKHLAESERPYSENTAVSKLWKATGMTALNTQKREAVFGSPLPDDLLHDL